MQLNAGAGLLYNILEQLALTSLRWCSFYTLMQPATSASHSALL